MLKKCQIFTPEPTVNVLLDQANYISNLYGKKIMENSCGDGNILKGIVQRYIKDSICQHKNIQEIKYGLENDIYGFELDDNHYSNCIKNLNEIAMFFNIKNVNWQLFNRDFLKFKDDILFDYIIGNPPYITYRDIDKKNRDYLKATYSSCSHGKFDYCYAFIESSIKKLNTNGILTYLIPSSIFKNVFAKNLREVILPNTVKIIDYKTKPLFLNATTSSAILICNRGINSTFIEYTDAVSKSNYKIPKINLEDKWTFSTANITSNKKQRFGDYFAASISIATLLNKAYILKKFTYQNDFIVINNHRIERSIVRKAASPKSLKYNSNEKIIFPYKYNNKNILKRYTEELFQEKFPNAVNYLRTFAKELNNRKSDDSTKWFEYGRTQALTHLNQPKLLLSTIITKKVLIYNLKKTEIPYSGIYIIPKDDNDKYTLDYAKKILESPDFFNYVMNQGISVNGNSVRITAPDINNYMF